MFPCSFPGYYPHVIPSILDNVLPERMLRYHQDSIVKLASEDADNVLELRRY
jgi:hypothetical protein